MGEGALCLHHFSCASSLPHAWGTGDMWTMVLVCCHILVAHGVRFLLEGVHALSYLIPTHVIHEGVSCP